MMPDLAKVIIRIHSALGCKGTSVSCDRLVTRFLCAAVRRAMKTLILKIYAPAVWGLGNSQPRLLNAHCDDQKEKNKGNVNDFYFNYIKPSL